MTCNAAGLPPLARPGRLPRGRQWRPRPWRATMRWVLHPETNGVKASPHRLKWMLSRGALAAPSDPWNFDAPQYVRLVEKVQTETSKTGEAACKRRKASSVTRHGRHRTSPALHVTCKTRSRRLAVAPLHHGASRCTMEHHDALTIAVFGGVKRAPRGNSMGQMGQRVRHG